MASANVWSGFEGIARIAPTPWVCNSLSLWPYPLPDLRPPTVHHDPLKFTRATPASSYSQNPRSNFLRIPSSLPTSSQARHSEWIHYSVYNSTPGSYFIYITHIIIDMTYIPNKSYRILEDIENRCLVFEPTWPSGTICTAYVAFMFWILVPACE